MHCVVFSALIATLTLSSCKFDDNNIIPPADKIGSVFVLNEGNRGASNSSLSVYNPQTKSVVNDFFATANNAPLGDSPTSVSFYNGNGYVTISNSGKIYVIDPLTGKLVKKITDLNSPRYMVGAGGDRAYLSNLYSNHIDVLNLLNNTVEKKIDLKEGQFVDQFVKVGHFVYTNCWSYGTQILKIDTRSDDVVGSVEVGVQPMCLFLDAKNNLWTMTDGGYEGNPIGNEDPKLVCLDLNLNIIKEFTVKREPMARSVKMAMANLGETIYFQNLNLFKLHINSTELPNSPFIDLSTKNVYGLAVDPVSDDIYMSDAVDFVQNGAVLRYDSQGKLLDSFTVGINPGAFSFHFVR